MYDPRGWAHWATLTQYVGSGTDSLASRYYRKGNVCDQFFTKFNDTEWAHNRELERSRVTSLDEIIINIRFDTIIHMVSLHPYASKLATRKLLHGMLSPVAQYKHDNMSKTTISDIGVQTDDNWGQRRPNGNHTKL